MALYNKFRYIYPNRPKNAIPSKAIPDYDNGRFLAEPKFNGSCYTIFTNGDEVRVMNRHNQVANVFNITKDEIIGSLYKSENKNWQIIVGEYMNKAKLDENKQLFNHKFVIHDILCFNGNYLIGNTIEQRVNLITNLYGLENYNDLLYKTSENIFVTKVFKKDFLDTYNKIITIDMIEGLVIKRANAPLEIGLSEDNNSRSMVKARKPTKNYSF